MKTEHKFKDYFEGAETGDMCALCGFKMASRKGSCNAMYTSEFYASERYLKCDKFNPLLKEQDIINQVKTD